MGPADIWNGVSVLTQKETRMEMEQLVGLIEPLENNDDSFWNPSGPSTVMAAPLNLERRTGIIQSRLGTDLPFTNSAGSTCWCMRWRWWGLFYIAIQSYQVNETGFEMASSAGPIPSPHCRDGVCRIQARYYLDIPARRQWEMSNPGFGSAFNRKDGNSKYG